MRRLDWDIFHSNHDDKLGTRNWLPTNFLNLICRHGWNETGGEGAKIFFLFPLNKLPPSHKRAKVQSKSYHLHEGGKENIFFLENKLFFTTKTGSPCPSINWLVHKEESSCRRILIAASTYLCIAKYKSQYKCAQGKIRFTLRSQNYHLHRSENLHVYRVQDCFAP